VTAVVSDTSPINYLLLIGQIDLLPKLFTEVVIPAAVFEELSHRKAPSAVKSWISQLPSWARVSRPHRIEGGLGLHLGETEAISLALELKIPAILIDERAGRTVAENRGLVAVGTLNILDAADRRGYVDFEAAVKLLRTTSFYVEEHLLNELIAVVKARKSSS